MITFEGHEFDPRTVQMIKAARILCTAPMPISQGSYSHAAVSAGTHSGGGAVDINPLPTSNAARQEIVRCMRQVGFAAWLRTPSQSNWPYHVHGIAIGCSDLSSQAAGQVDDYIHDRNGLASNGKDDGPRDYVGVTWESFINGNDDVRLELGMALSNEAVKQVARIVNDAIAANEAKNGNATYAKAFWIAPTGTGTAIRSQLAHIATAVNAVLVSGNKPPV